jgi:aminoglycoside phosphotransferase (APT) family kinase protein
VTSAVDSDAEFVPEATVVGFDRDRLARHLADNGLEYDAREPIRQFAGGLANRNYLIRLSGRPAVFRRPPDGDLPPGAHDMAREHLILSHIAPVFAPAPASIHFCADTTVLGAPFQILEYRSGPVLRGNGVPPGLEREGAALSRTLTELLAQVHRIDVDQCGLGQFGRPLGFIERAIAGWRKRGSIVAAGTPDEAIISSICVWLEQKPIAARTPTLLHLDLKFDNVVLDPESLAPRAVLDWDMGTRGDPLFDLATMLSYWAEPGEEEVFAGIDQAMTCHPGFWRRSEVAAAYAASTGRSIDDLPTLRVLALLRLGVVFLQLHAQWTSGAVKSARYAKFAEQGRKLLIYAWDTARRGLA